MLKLLRDNALVRGMAVGVGLGICGLGLFDLWFWILLIPCNVILSLDFVKIKKHLKEGV